MLAPSPTTKTRSLRAPVATEEERLLFERRLRLSSFVVFVLTGGFWVIATTAMIVVSPSAEAARERVLHPASLFHLGTVVVAFTAWLLVRRGNTSPFILDVVDITSTFGMCLLFTLMVMRREFAIDRPEMVSLLACTYTLVSRAALIPSAPLRTAFVSALSVAPAIPASVWVYSDGYKGLSPLHPTVYTAIWVAITIGTTTVISHVIYGLRLEIQKAMQLGQYVLEEQIGRGGMGVVYRARHALLRRPTAIKLLPKGEGKERFEREVQITAGLTHPNTIAVFDYGHTPEGVFYYAMEFLDGVTLEELVLRHGAQRPERVVHLLLQICGALQEAHAAGLVHRDIKPANIMLTERGGVRDVVKVLDFGLVKERATEGDGAVTVVGTPHYMAPEAVSDPEGVDPRADLYAVGAVGYWLLTGQRVFEGDSIVEVLSQHMHERPKPPSEIRKGIPAELERVILACLAKDRDDRPKHAATVVAMLRACALPEWTVDDAATWWSTEGAAAGARAPKAERADTLGASDLLGTTMDIDLGAR